MNVSSTSVPMEPIRPRPAVRVGRGRTRSTTRIANGWAASWHGLQQGDRLQAGTISELQISMISLGGVIGSGLLVGSGTALRHAGPGGVVVGYVITGSVVYCINRSLAQIVSCFPRSGGPVGLAHLYVDPALAFALGWMAYYSWTIVYPVQIAVGSILIVNILPFHLASINAYYICVAISIFLTVCVSLSGARWYGRMETVFSLIKICIIIWIPIHCLVLAARAGPDEKEREGFFRYWYDPGAFVQYRSSGAFGRFLAIWSVQLQACFSFFGTEVAVMAVAEVRHPEVSISKAARRVWIWIFVSYVAGVFGPGLLVPHDDEDLDWYIDPSSTMYSPFIIAMGRNNDRLLVAAAVIFALAALSTALTNVFVSSRLLFFLSKCGHAPEWCSKVLDMPFSLGRVPIAGVLITGACGTLVYMYLSTASEAFGWLSTMASTAALSSWIGMLVTYLKFIYGIETAIARSNNDEPVFRRFVAKYGERFPTSRGFAKLSAWYALLMCSAVLLFNGWAVFTIPGQWIIATTPDYQPPYDEDLEILKPVATFVTSYLPVPFMLLLIYGYKLINRTQSVTTEDMILNMSREWDQQIAAEEKEHRGEHRQWRAHQPRSLYRLACNALDFIFSRDKRRI